jgi:hypothetical protein
MPSLPIDPPALAVSAARKERAPQFLALALAAGVGFACGWRGHEVLSGLIATGAVWLGFWLGRQLGRAWLGLVMAAVMSAGFVAAVKLAWEAALLLALIGTVAILRWRNDPAPALVLVAIAAGAGFAWLLWPR